MHQSSYGLASGIRARRQRKGRGITMFKELLPLLEGRTMILAAAKIGDALTVTIYPKRNGEKDENPVGNTPLCVTGTPEYGRREAWEGRRAAGAGRGALPIGVCSVIE